jgi:hypothetical protein
VSARSRPAPASPSGDDSQSYHEQRRPPRHHPPPDGRRSAAQDSSWHQRFMASDTRTQQLARSSRGGPVSPTRPPSTTSGDRSDQPSVGPGVADLQQRLAALGYGGLDVGYLRGVLAAYGTPRSMQFYHDKNRRSD